MLPFYRCSSCSFWDCGLAVQEGGRKMNRQDKCISLDLAKQIAAEHERLGIVVEE